MGNETKNFHFMEMDWLVYFPKDGNKGKYLGYNVLFRDRKEVISEPKHITLQEIVETPEFENKYPHTIGYYKEASGEGTEFKPEYLEIRRVNSVEEFWLFLNALDI